MTGSTPAMAPETRRVIITLTVLAVVGVAGSGWLLYYTDWFPVVGGLLGLGGVFAWLAFLSNLLSGDRKKEIQAAFEAAVLQKRRTAVIGVAVAVVLLVVIAPFWGTLMIDTLGDDTSRTVEIHQLGDGKDTLGPLVSRQLLSPRSDAKVRLYTGWFRRKSYYVKVAGLPGATVEIPKIGRAVMSVPSDLFGRPVVLVRPAFTSAAAIKTGGHTLKATLDGQPLGTIQSYAGNPIWIGADHDVAIPAGLQERWRAEVRANPNLLPNVTDSLGEAGSITPYHDLSPSSVVAVELSDDMGRVLYRGQAQIPKLGPRPDFPIELIIGPAE